MTRNIQLRGNIINLRGELGYSKYEKISNFLKNEVGYSLEELEREITIVKIGFVCSAEAINMDIKGLYIRNNKQLWLKDTNDTEVIVHEFVHVAQFKRNGFKAKLKAKLTTFSNIMIRLGIKWFYYHDYYENEARMVADKYKQMETADKEPFINDMLKKRYEGFGC